jgi:DNA-binding CsgD family transcriptional regulator
LVRHDTYGSFSVAKRLEIKLISSAVILAGSVVPMSKKRKSSTLKPMTSSQADEARADIPSLLSDMKLTYLDLNNEPERINRIKEILKTLPDRDVVGLANRLHHEKNQMTHNPDDFFETYNISPAEADLLENLANGISVTDHAVGKKVSVNTVRTQIRSLLEKTNASSQTDLVRMYLTHRTPEFPTH